MASPQMPKTAMVFAAAWARSLMLRSVPIWTPACEPGSSATEWSEPTLRISKAAGLPFEKGMRTEDESATHAWEA